MFYTRSLMNKLYYSETFFLPFYGIRYRGKNTIRPKTMESSFLIENYISKNNIDKKDLVLTSNEYIKCSVQGIGRHCIEVDNEYTKLKKTLDVYSRFFGVLSFLSIPFVLTGFFHYTSFVFSLFPLF